jgi:hypothetical protein
MWGFILFLGFILLFYKARIETNFEVGVLGVLDHGRCESITFID